MTFFAAPSIASSPRPRSGRNRQNAATPIHPFAALICASLFLAAPASAQVSAGITGTVVDASGGVVSGGARDFNFQFQLFHGGVKTDGASARLTVRRVYPS